MGIVKKNSKMRKEEILRYESAQRSAEHYDIMIWTVFSVGVALSLFILYTVWPLKNNLGFMHLFTSFIGYMILFVSVLAVESFSQKLLYFSEIQYKLQKENLGELTYFGITWLIEGILSLIFISYIFLFLLASLNNVYTSPNMNFYFMFLTLIFFIISIISFGFILFNWVTRPKGDRGNCLEKLRKCIMGNKLKTYEEIINQKK